MVTLHLPPAHDIPGEVQVLIAGGGPSGLFLALDLAARGIPSTVIEPRDAVDHTRPRAKTTNARTMTHLRRLGLADALRAASPLPVDYAQDVIFCTGLTGPAAHELRRFRNAFQLVPAATASSPNAASRSRSRHWRKSSVPPRQTVHLVTFITGWSVQTVQPAGETSGTKPPHAVVVSGPAGAHHHG
jgi:threonine dehydrogenase-like Zn-dependent dehydrogenase